MNSKFVVVIFAAVLFVIVKSQTDLPTVFPDSSGECGENEIWNECGSPCPPKCGQFNRPMCLTVCVPSCQCTRGYVRDALGKCIPPQQCPIKPIPGPIGGPIRTHPFPEDPVGPQLPPIQ